MTNFCLVNLNNVTHSVPHTARIATIVLNLLFLLFCLSASISSCLFLFILLLIRALSSAIQTSQKSIINPPSFPPQHHFCVNFRQPPSPFSPLPSHIFLKNKNQTFHLILISSYIPFSSPFPRSSIFTFSRHLLYLFDQAPAFSHMKTARSTKT